MIDIRAQRWLTRVATGLIGLLVGCGPGSGTLDNEWIADIRTVGDTTIVQTLSGSEWQSAELVLDFRIGTLEGEEHEMFGDIQGLAVSPAGDVYLYDRHVPALRRYGSDGTYRATIGRQGGGPGEYGNSDGGLTVLSDGRVVLRDPGNGRFSVYGPDDEYLDSWPGPAGTFTTVPLVPGSNGEFYNPAYTPGGTHLAKYGSHGEPRDTIRVPLPDVTAPTIEARSADGGVVQRWAVPFSAGTVWAVGPDGSIFTARTDQYVIDRHRPDGTVLRIARDTPPVPVSSGERSSEQARVSEAMRRVDPGWRWDGPAIPSTKPMLRSLFPAGDGRLWVLLRQPGEELPGEPDSDGNPGPPRFREAVVFDVFEADGRYLGQVSAPEGIRLHPRPVFGADGAWAIVTDEFDVQYLARLRLLSEESG